MSKSGDILIDALTGKDRTKPYRVYVTVERNYVVRVAAKSEKDARRQVESMGPSEIEISGAFDCDDVVTHWVRKDGKV